MVLPTIINSLIYLQEVMGPDLRFYPSMVLMMKNERCGHFVADNLTQQAQLTACGQIVAKAMTTIGLSGDHSFLFVSDCKETLDMCDTKVHFPSELTSELFWCRKFCRPFCPMVCPETVWVVFSAKILYENLSICFVYSGSCPEVSVIEGKSPSYYFDNTTI